MIKRSLVTVLTLTVFVLPTNRSRQKDSKKDARNANKDRVGGDPVPKEECRSGECGVSCIRPIVNSSMDFLIESPE